MLQLAKAIVEGLDDAHRALEPAAGLKTAGWLLGHLATSGDHARWMLGRPPICPASWRHLYAPGTQPSGDENDYPPMRALIDTFFAVYDDLCDAALEAPSRVLEDANPYEPARDPFPTVGSFLTYLLSSHLGYHLGQMTAWRASAGLARPRRPDTLAA